MYVRQTRSAQRCSNMHSQCVHTSKHGHKDTGSGTGTDTGTDMDREKTASRRCGRGLGLDQRGGLNNNAPIIRQRIRRATAGSSGAAGSSSPAAGSSSPAADAARSAFHSSHRCSACNARRTKPRRTFCVCAVSFVSALLFLGVNAFGMCACMCLFIWKETHGIRLVG